MPNPVPMISLSTDIGWDLDQLFLQYAPSPQTGTAWRTGGTAMSRFALRVTGHSALVLSAHAALSPHREESHHTTCNDERSRNGEDIEAACR